MDFPGLDVVIWGITAAGRPFRPGAWTDRIAGLTPAFGEDRKLIHSPLVLPVLVGGARAVIVGSELEAVQPPQPASAQRGPREPARCGFQAVRRWEHADWARKKRPRALFWGSNRLQRVRPAP
jgi:hypothetical protein